MVPDALVFKVLAHGDQQCLHARFVNEYIFGTGKTTMVPVSTSLYHRKTD